MHFEASIISCLLIIKPTNRSQVASFVSTLASWKWD